MKYLTAPINLNAHSSVLFQEIQGNYKFSRLSKAVAAISPYCIITDGHDICKLTGVSSNSNGFLVEVKQNNGKNFQDIINIAIQQKFKKLFKSDIKCQDMSIHACDKAVYLDGAKRKSIIPFYLIILSNTKKIHIECNEDFILIPKNIFSALTEGGHNFLDSILYKWCRDGDLTFPVISYPSKLSEVDYD